MAAANTNITMEFTQTRLELEKSMQLKSIASSLSALNDQCVNQYSATIDVCNSIFDANKKTIECLEWIPDAISDAVKAIEEQTKVQERIAAALEKLAGVQQ